jgi:hypothetical protein
MTAQQLLQQLLDALDRGNGRVWLRRDRDGALIIDRPVIGMTPLRVSRIDSETLAAMLRPGPICDQRYYSGNESAVLSEADLVREAS